MRTFGIALVLVTLAASAQEKSNETWSPPEDVQLRRANIFSEGTRMAAEVFTPRGSEGKKLPPSS